MCKGLYAVLFAILCIVLFSFSVYAIDISAKSAILLEAQGGEIVFEKNANERLPMASTTKIMTAIVVIENCPLNKKVKIEPYMTGVEGSSIYLQAGEELTVEELLYALMLESANDAAVALAYAVGGGIDSFAEMMNDKASSLGLTSTHFENPHGLDSQNHYTTAKELGIIAAYAMKNKDFARIASTTKTTVSSQNGNGARLLINHNRLLRTYDGANGVKTGFTKRCGRCLVSSALRNGVSMICVTLSAPNDWKDHEKLLDYGFERFVNINLVSENEYNIELNTVNGQKSFVSATNSRGLSATLPRGSINISAVLESNRLISAPIYEGEQLGRIVFYNNGDKIGEVPIVATETVRSIKYKKSILERIFG